MFGSKVSRITLGLRGSAILDSHINIFARPARVQAFPLICSADRTTCSRLSRLLWVPPRHAGPGAVVGGRSSCVPTSSSGAEQVDETRANHCESGVHVAILWCAGLLLAARVWQARGAGRRRAGGCRRWKGVRPSPLLSVSYDLQVCTKRDSPAILMMTVEGTPLISACQNLTANC